MKLYPNKASRSFSGMGSLFLLLTFLSTPMWAAEVTRSLSLEDRVRLLEQQLSSANRMRAESQFEITALKNEVRTLRGQVEEQGYQLQQIVNRQRELYRSMADNNSQPTPPATTTGSTGNSSNLVGTSTGPTNTPSPEQQTPANNVKSPAVNTVTEVNDAEVRAAYDKIFPLVRSKRYDDAIAGYQRFIAQYPDSIYVANSRYWLAQIYSVQGRSEEAEREYLNVAQQFPTSAKAADSWLKLGKLYEAQGQTGQAIDAYNQVVTAYSSSTAAQMAINRLQVLKSSN
ncbi:MAG: tol-pal system protein YbgF [Gammaproteobacteria bacterium]|nr:MAG: tol-pal system protein YbgF [Gammaproteobacteria bacterium]